MHKTNAQDREKEVEGKPEKQKEKIEERDRKMLSLLFVVLMIMVFGKLLGIALKATWSIAKIVVTLIFCPVVLLVLVIAGLIYIAFPVLLIAGIVLLLVSPKRT